MNFNRLLRRRVRSLAAHEQRGKVHFVISSPRSGSTWLQRALNHHPDVFCTEHRFFGRFCEIWPNGDGTSHARITLDEYTERLSEYARFNELGMDRKAFEQQIRDQFIDALLRFEFQCSQKTVIVDKITPYVGTSHDVLKSFASEFPQSQVIQLMRDGRDVVTSGVFDWVKREAVGSPRHEFFVNQDPSVRLTRFFDDDTLRNWTIQWFQPIEAIEQLRPQTPCIKYEEMKQDQCSVLARLSEWLGVNAEAKVLKRCVDQSQFQVMSGGRKAGEGVATAKVRRGVVGDWRNYFTRRDGEIFGELAGDFLVRNGYERDDQWIAQLPEELELKPPAMNHAA